MVLGLLALVLPALGCGAGLAATSGPRDFVLDDVSFALRELRYPSGLRVVAERDSRSPVVGTFLVVGAGSSQDPAGKEGLAHYIEHLAFRSRPFGTASYPHELGRLGVRSWNAQTDFDATVYYEIGPRASLTGMLRLVGARMGVPIANISDEALAVELDVVKNELRQRNETGYRGEVLSALRPMLFPPGHPYARPVLGTHASLATLTPDDVGAFIRAHYRPSNMTLVVLGDVNLDTIERTLSETLPAKVLGAAQRAPDVVRLPEVAPVPPAPQGSADIVRKEGAVSTPELWIAWTLPRGFDKDAAKIDYIAQHAAGALRRAAFSDEDIVFVQVMVAPGVAASVLYCRVGLRSGQHPNESREHVLDNLYRLWSIEGGAEGVGSIETRRAAVLGMLFDAEDLQTRGMARALSTHFVQDASMYSRTFARIQGLDGAEPGWSVETYLQRERARTVLIVPETGRASVNASTLGTLAYDDDPLEVLPADVAALRAVSPPPGAGSFLTETLASGLRVVIVRRPGLPLVVASLGVAGGRAIAPDPAAAWAAELLREPSGVQIPTRPFGGRLDEAADETRYFYAAEGSSGNIGILLEALAAHALNMRVRAESWEPFQSYVVPYLAVAEAKPEVRANHALRALLFPDHPLGHPATVAGLRETSVWKAKEWLDLTHVPKGSVLVVVGDIDPQATRKFVSDTFGSWSDDDPGFPAPLPPNVVSGPAAPRRVLLTSRPGASQAEITVGCLLSPATTATAARRHHVLAAVLQRKLSTVLREQAGAAYAVRAEARSIPGGSAWLELSSAVESNKLALALAGFRDAFVQTSAGSSNAEAELSWAKLDVASALAPGSRNLDFVTAIDRALALDYPLQSLDTVAEDVASVTQDAVREDASICLANALALSLVGDEATLRAAVAAAWSGSPPP